MRAPCSFGAALSALVLVLPLAAGTAQADDEGLHFQLQGGAGGYALHDSVPLRPGPNVFLTEGLLDPIGLPDLALHAGSSIGPRLALDIGVRTRQRKHQSRNLYRSDLGATVGLRFYPWRVPSFAPFAELSGGISTRSIQERSPCFIGCDRRLQAADQAVRPLVAAGIGVEWYPWEGGFHLLSRLDLESAVPRGGHSADVWIGGALGVGYRVR